MLTDKATYVLSDRGQFVTDGSAAATTPGDMDDAFARFKQQRDDALNAGKTPPAFVLFFHGGLVSQDSFLNDATDLVSPYTAAGAGYPYFFVWRSGLGETIMDWVHDKLGGVMTNQKVTAAVLAANDESEKPENAAQLQPVPTFMELTASHKPLASPSDDSALMTQLTARYRTMPEAQNLQHLFDENPHASPAQPMARALRTTTAMTDAEVAGTVRAALAPPAQAAMQQRTFPLPIAIDIPAILAAATIRVIWRNIHHRNHPGISTMSEEVARGLGIAFIGQKLWSEMKNDCTSAFNATGVGAAFIQRLKTLANDGRPLRIFLIGHSAGTIYINDFMNAVAASQVPNNVTFDVVFMAAAIRSDLFSTLLQAPVAARIDHFRSFGLQDPSEQSCGLTEGFAKPIDFLFQASLLYVIAGILEPEPQVDVPLAGMDRFIGVNTRFAGEAEDQLIIDYATRARPSVWSPTNGAPHGYACTARSHGGFPHDPACEDSMETLIQGWV